MRIPEVREELRELARVHGIDRLSELADELVRRKVFRQGRTTSRSITPGIRRAIREFASENPTLNQVEIGRRFGVNPGRVSEALSGKRQ